MDSAPGTSSSNSPSGNFSGSSEKSSSGSGSDAQKNKTSQKNNLELEVKSNSPVDLKDNRFSNTDLRVKYSPSLGGVKCVLLDIEGTLCDIEDEAMEPIYNAVETYSRLKEVGGFRIVLVVNSLLWSKAKVRDQLLEVGFDVEIEDIFTSADCCKIFMENHCCIHPLLLIGDDLRDDFKEFDVSNPMEFDCVVLGLPFTMIEYFLWTKAITVLESDKPLIVLNPAKYEKSVGTGYEQGPGSLGKTLAFLTDSKEIVTGKPTAGFYTEACNYAGFPTNECVMIGDDIDQDVKGAKSTDLKTILVKTGSYKDMDEKKYCGFSPDAVADNFDVAIKILLSAQSKFMTETEVEEKKRKLKLDIEKKNLDARLDALTMDSISGGRYLGPVKLPSYIW